MLWPVLGDVRQQQPDTLTAMVGCDCDRPEIDPGAPSRSALPVSITAALMWGTEDLLAGLGGCSSRWPDGRYRDVAVHARNTDLISASAKGKADVPHLSLSVWPPTWEMGCSLALVTGALIEREIRNAMANAGTSHIPLYPELRACTAPSAARILELFSDLTRHQTRHDASPRPTPGGGVPDQACRSRREPPFAIRRDARRCTPHTPVREPGEQPDLSTQGARSPSRPRAWPRE